MRSGDQEAKRPGIFREKFGLFSMVIASIYLIYVSIFPIIFNLTGDFNGFDLAVNLIIFAVGIGVLHSTILFARRTVLYARSIDLAFEDIYPRIEPILREVASVHVDLDMMRGRLDAMNMNIAHLRRQMQPADQPQSYNAGGGEDSEGDGSGGGDGSGNSSGSGGIGRRGGGTTVTTFLHLVLLANITLGVFIFLLQYPRGYVPYVLTILYVVWWLAITAEYDLWRISGAWTWVFVPILMIPTISIMTDILAGSYMLLAWMALGLVAYTGAYYLWGRYLIHGILPFDLQERLKFDRAKMRPVWHRENKR